MSNLDGMFKGRVICFFGMKLGSCSLRVADFLDIESIIATMLVLPFSK